MTLVYVPQPSAGGSMPMNLGEQMASPYPVPYWYPASESRSHYEVTINVSNTHTSGPFSWGDWATDSYFVDVVQRWSMSGSSISYQFGESHSSGNYFSAPNFYAWSGHSDSNVTTVQHSVSNGTVAHLLDQHAQNFDYSGVNYTDVNGVQHTNTWQQSSEQHSGEASWASIFGGQGNASWDSFSSNQTTTNSGAGYFDQHSESITVSSSSITMESPEGDVAGMLPPPHVLVAMAHVDMFGGKG
jgi:hypothetical protein